jgi:hypothetical protein
VALPARAHVESLAEVASRAAATQAEERRDVALVGKSTCAQEQDGATPSRSSEVAFRMSPQDRDDLLRSLISSQAIEGVEVSYAEAERILDEVLREALPIIR